MRPVILNAEQNTVLAHTETSCSSHYPAYFPAALEQIAEWLAAGKLRRWITVLDGLDKAPDGLASMFSNGIIGKMCVQVSPSR